MKPMLAVDHDPAKLRFPVLASPKLDGLRCVIKDGRVLSRTLKDIPSQHVQRVLKDPVYNGLDGELIVGSPTAPDVFANTTSNVMAISKTFDFTYYVFDFWNNNGPYQYRVDILSSMMESLYESKDPSVGCIKILPQKLISGPQELAMYEAEQIAAGYEGVILRDPQGRYKFGRSTVNE